MTKFYNPDNQYESYEVVKSSIGHVAHKFANVYGVIVTCGSPRHFSLKLYVVRDNKLIRIDNRINEELFYRVVNLTQHYHREKITYNNLTGFSWPSDCGLRVGYIINALSYAIHSEHYWHFEIL